MGLTKYKLGELLTLSERRNSRLQFGLGSVKGISIQKNFIDTKADMTGVSLRPYFLVEPDSFAYVTVTSRNGEKITIAHNDTDETYIVSSSYVVFHVDKPDALLSDYLFMYFNRPEFDRYARFNSWGSAREVFSWEEMCNIDIDLPPITVQQKYVDVYKALLENQRCYERGLDDLKLVCDGYIEDLRRKMPSEKIGPYIVQKNVRNSDKKILRVMGLSTKKDFREAQSRVNRNELGTYKVVNPNEFVFVPTTDTWKVLAFSYNSVGENIVVSPTYEVFAIRGNTLLPEYLAMWLSRVEFDRYARFHSWGSARENFTFADMCEVKIPIPSLDVQHSIVGIYKAYMTRREINERLKAQIKAICPVLIKGSLDEGRN